MAFSFTPMQGRLGSIAGRAQSVAAQGQQALSAAASNPDAQAPSNLDLNSNFGVATPPAAIPAAPGAPAANQPQPVSVHDIIHHIANLFGGGDQAQQPYANMDSGISAAAAAQADPVNVSGGYGADAPVDPALAIASGARPGSPQFTAYLARLFGA